MLRSQTSLDSITLTFTCQILFLNVQSYGLQLEGNVVLLDEAHNLVEAIQSMHDAMLTGE